jgi:uncharacterized protein YeaC (DUF1315 family)
MEAYMVEDTTNIPAKFLSFSAEVRKLCSEKQMECIDAVVHWCDLNNVEVEFAATLIKNDPMMKSMIQMEAENLNILKKTAKLPF